MGARESRLKRAGECVGENQVSTTNVGTESVQTVVKTISNIDFEIHKAGVDAFCAGFFLNPDLDCARIQNCNVNIFWPLYCLCEKNCNGVKYRIVKAHGYPCTYVLVKTAKDAAMRQWEINRSQVELDTSNGIQNEYFKQFLHAFMEDSECLVLTLRNLQVSDFPPVVSALRECAQYKLFTTQTLPSATLSSQFDYVVMMKQTAAVDNPQPPAEAEKKKEETEGETPKSKDFLTRCEDERKCYY
jgi:hypothetical protein